MCILFIISILSLLVGISQSVIYAGDKKLIEIDEWQLGDSYDNVSIIWQKSEMNTDKRYSSSLPNSGLVASSEHVIYYYENSQNPDELRQLIALDLYTGTTQWSFSGKRSSFPKTDYLANFDVVMNAGTGYMFIAIDSYVSMINESGKLVWVNETLPSREVRFGYSSESHVYLPSNDGVYELSLDDGEIEQFIPFDNLLNYTDNYSIVLSEEALFDESDESILSVANFADANNSIDIVDNVTGNSIFMLKLQEPYSIGEAYLIHLPFGQITKGYLIVYDSYLSPEYFAIYDIDEQSLLWQSETPILGIPIIFEDLLIAYTRVGLQFYDLATGKLQQTILLENKNVEDTITDVWLASYDNIILINFRNLFQIIALEVD